MVFFFFLPCHQTRAQPFTEMQFTQESSTAGHRWVFSFHAKQRKEKKKDWTIQRRGCHFCSIQEQNLNLCTDTTQIPVLTRSCLWGRLPSRVFLALDPFTLESSAGGLHSRTTFQCPYNLLHRGQFKVNDDPACAMQCVCTLQKVVHALLIGVISAHLNRIELKLHCTAFLCDFTYNS